MDTLIQSKRSYRQSKALPGQVAVTLSERIRSGQYQPGCKLPAERCLEGDLGVDRRTIRAAIQQMATDGILDVRPKCRPVIRATTPRLVEPKLIALVMLSGDSFGPESRRHRIFWGLNEGLAGSGLYGVPLDLTPRTTESYKHKAEQEAEYLTYVLEHGFSGVVFHPQSYNSNRELLRTVARKMPLVLLDYQIPGVQADFVGIDNRRLALEATRNLILQGHKRIAFLTSGEFSITAHERLEGYIEGLNDAFPVDPYEMVLTPPLGKSRSWPMFDAICRLPVEQRPTGIVCSSNQEAVRAASYLGALNICMPEDVSIIGFEGKGQSPHVGSAPTASAQPFEMGKVAAALILRRCQEPSVDLAHIELAGSPVSYDVAYRPISWGKIA